MRFHYVPIREETDLMQMRRINVTIHTPAATYLATEASCWQKPIGFLRPGDTQALARRCSR